MNTLFGVILLIILFYIFGMAWETISIKKINYTRYVDKEVVFPKEEIIITTVLSNNKILPLPWIEIYSELPEAIIYKDQIMKHRKIIKTNVYKVITSLFPFQKVTRRNRFVINKRGYYKMDDLEITIGDILGFSKGILKVNSPLRIIVYPEIKRINELIIQENSPQGEISVRRWIIPDPIDIKGVREYTTRDSFNTIDWKATAKTGDLHVKEFDFTSEASIMVLLNVQCDEQPWRDLNEGIIEYGITISAAIMNECIESKIPIGFATNGILDSDDFINDKLSIITPDINPRQGENILGTLAKVSYMSKIKIESLIDNIINIYDTYTTIVLVTPYLNKGSIELINECVDMGYNIKLILIKDGINTSMLNSRVVTYTNNNLNSTREVEDLCLEF
ncbi:DUF58 domain-containing protein [Clostridium sp. D2Q-11]|uniref:DUF58 domain-containing protein n=1 Tax=Anaeromonas frigoriresistens TaxID=2683708 RepID=A0A942UUN2_9FIRM|nr:DUF58 domain-containing protein [Anaeromonas frigoriresistens]MBS4537109.1 DUF58 domain-containing protein [Anaeromonas frigoriresistens]